MYILKNKLILVSVFQRAIVCSQRIKISGARTDELDQTVYDVILGLIKSFLGGAFLKARDTANACAR